MQTITATMVETKEKPLNMVILGYPGCGKGTQSKLLAEVYNLKHISSGDLLRLEIEKNTGRAKKLKEYMESGTLFPDELVNEIVLECVPEENFILDGYPRKLSQTETIDNVNFALYIDLKEEEAIERILNRKDGRVDDNREVVRVRLQTFREKTQPVIDHYRSMGSLHEVDGSGTPEEVFRRVKECVSKHRENK